MLLQNEKMMNILFQSCISWLRWNKVLDPAAVFFLPVGLERVSASLFWP